MDDGLSDGHQEEQEEEEQNGGKQQQRASHHLCSLSLARGFYWSD